MTGRRLRVEIGYGLEAYFPDAFVSYLMTDHVRAFFDSGSPTLGLQLTLRILHHRIREAILGHAFDPRPLTMARRSEALSGGAGASTAMGPGGAPAEYVRAPLDPDTRARLVPQDTPGGTYRRYLEWLVTGRFDPEVRLFTPDSRRFLASLPMTRAYLDYILLKEYGRAHRVAIRGDLALLYFTDDPLVDPHFFRGQEGRWQMDLVAEVRNTQNRVGGEYAWHYRGREDDFSRTFADMLVDIRGYVRIADGDNRMLSLRRRGGTP